MIYVVFISPKNLGMQKKSASFFQKFNSTSYVTFLSKGKIPQRYAENHQLEKMRKIIYMEGGGGGCA